MRDSEKILGSLALTINLALSPLSNKQKHTHTYTCIEIGKLTSVNTKSIQIF
jgi:hypothetical protein